MSLVKELQQLVSAKSRVPKPQSKKEYRLVRMGKSRGEQAVVYELPKRPESLKASTKRIPVSVFEAGATQLSTTGSLTRAWFVRKYPHLEDDGTCNFTTLGGVLELLGLAHYTGPGEYSPPPTTKG